MLLTSHFSREKSNFLRKNHIPLAEVALAANSRLINPLADASLQGKAIDRLDDLCRSHGERGRKVSRFNPVEPDVYGAFLWLLSSHAEEFSAATTVTASLSFKAKPPRTTKYSPSLSLEKSFQRAVWKVDSFENVPRCLSQALPAAATGQAANPRESNGAGG